MKFPWKDQKQKRAAFAEMYGMGDVQIGRQITGQYPNPSVIPDVLDQLKEQSHG